MGDATESYRRLRDATDRRVRELLATHGRRIVCRPGCAQCCTDLTVFPVEYQAILEDLRRAGVRELPFDESAGCGFLLDGLCVIYEFRPLICRTHGLPIAFAADGAPPGERSVSFCPRNFADGPVAAPAFGPDNTLDLDALNGELFAVNLAFLSESGQGRRSPASRAPLRRLCEDVSAVAEQQASDETR